MPNTIDRNYLREVFSCAEFLGEDINELRRGLNDYLDKLEAKYGSPRTVIKLSDVEDYGRFCFVAETEKTDAEEAAHQAKKNAQEEIDRNTYIQLKVKYNW